MPQITPAGARVINPVLTNIAQGIKQSDFVGSALFPIVPVAMRAGNILTFNREDFMQYSNIARAPGENTRRVSFGYSSGTFALVDYSVEGSLPIEIMQEASSAANGFSLDGAMMAMQKASRILALRTELAQATLATTLSTYAAANRTTLSGTAQWSDYTGTSNPLSVIETGKEAVRAATGRRPNTCVMGASVMARLRQHPVITDRMKYTGRDIATTEILAGLFGVDRVLVGDAVWSNDAGTTLNDVWGKHLVLAYTETDTIANYGTPTFGYTYNLGGYPVVEEPYYDRNSKTWFFPVTRAEAPVVAAAGAGYFVQNAVA